MSFTTAELVTRAYRDYGLIGAEEMPSGADMVFGTETFDALNDQLPAEGIAIQNGSIYDLPSEYLIPMSRLGGVDLATAFGLMSIAEAEAIKPTLKAALRRINSNVSSGAPVRSEYF